VIAAEPPAIIVHSLAQARAAAREAAASGAAVELWSAAGAGGYAGVGWFAALSLAVRRAEPDARLTFVLDCADEAGTAMGALRRGQRHLRFTGPPAVAAKLADMGAVLCSGNATFLDLGGLADPAAACRKFLAAAGAPR
jgi:hypothetical protein